MMNTWKENPTSHDEKIREISQYQLRSKADEERDLAGEVKVDGQVDSQETSKKYLVDSQMR